MGTAWNELFTEDPLGAELVRQAAAGFDATSADRDLLKRVRQQSRLLAEEFLNAYLARDLDAQVADQIRNEIAKLRIERTVSEVCDELAIAYEHLKLIREHSRTAVELDYPQMLADPLILRAYPVPVISSAAKGSAEVQPLVQAIEKAHRAMGFPPEVIAPEIARRYTELSVPLLLNYTEITATKVYFMGPVFYGNAEDGWTLTFATGSGLPDPLEWNGAAWFMSRYGVSPDRLRTDKNPFRALNFSVGICNTQWRCRRLYVWQRSKTAAQLRGAFLAASEAGKTALFLADALAQLAGVYRTPNLKIIELDEFSPELTAWTRVSQKDVMLSCRPGTPEGKIAHALWLTPGLRLSEATVKRIKELAVGIVEAGVSLIPVVGPFLAVVAAVATMYLLDERITEEEERHRKTVLELQSTLDRAISALWDANDLPGIIKRSSAYTPSEALAAAAGTLAALLGDVSPQQVLEAYKATARSQKVSTSEQAP